MNLEELLSDDFMDTFLKKKDFGEIDSIINNTTNLELEKSTKELVSEVNSIIVTLRNNGDFSGILRIIILCTKEIKKAIKIENKMFGDSEIQENVLRLILEMEKLFNKV